MNKQNKRVFAICLCAVLALSSSAAAADITTSYDAPASLSTAIDSDLYGIVLTEVPAGYKAVLSNGERNLRAGDAVLSSDFEELTLIPMTQAEVTAQMCYIPVYADGSVGDETTVEVGIFSKKNSPPTADNLSIKTYKNIAVTENFSATDPDGDSVTYEITGAPKRGEAVMHDDGSFTYTPNKNKVGKDSFTYTATDSSGNVSENATVEIEISKPTSKLTYADMESEPAHYAALRLNEAGIFTGEKLGNEYFFKPEALVTRGEFLTAVMCLADTEISEDGISAGFADDDVTPTWVKPYITTALQNGIITGVTTTEGELVFRSQAFLTKAEAAVIIDNILGLGDCTQVMAYDDVVPAWAVQATANLQSTGILKNIGISGMNSSITRADMAMMLSSMMDVMEENESGLLSWVFE